LKPVKKVQSKNIFICQRQMKISVEIKFNKTHINVRSHDTTIH
jgi:hypothetical protein